MSDEHVFVTNALGTYWAPLLEMQQITLAGGGEGDPYLIGSDAQRLPAASQLFYQHVAISAGERFDLGSDRVVRVDATIDGWMLTGTDKESEWVGGFTLPRGNFYEFDLMMDPWSWLDEDQANSQGGALGFDAEPRYTIEGGWEREGDVFHTQMRFVILIEDGFE